MSTRPSRLLLIAFTLVQFIHGCRALDTGYRVLEDASDLEYLLGDASPDLGLSKTVNDTWSFALFYDVNSDNVDEWREVYLGIGRQADETCKQKKLCTLGEQVASVAEAQPTEMANYFSTCSDDDVAAYLGQIVGRGMITIETYLDNGIVYLRGTDGWYEDHLKTGALSRLDTAKISLEHDKRRPTARRLREIVTSAAFDVGPKPRFKVKLEQKAEKIGVCRVSADEGNVSWTYGEQEFREFVPVHVDRLVFVPWVHMPIHQRLQEFVRDEFLDVTFRLSMTPVVDGKVVYWFGEIVGYGPGRRGSTISYGKFLAWRATAP